MLVARCCIPGSHLKDAFRFATKYVRAFQVGPLTVSPVVEALQEWLCARLQGIHDKEERVSLS